MKFYQNASKAFAPLSAKFEYVTIFCSVFCTKTEHFYYGRYEYFIWDGFKAVAFNDLK